MLSKLCKSAVIAALLDGDVRKGGQRRFWLFGRSLSDTAAA